MTPEPFADCVTKDAAEAHATAQQKSQGVYNHAGSGTFNTFSVQLFILKNQKNEI